MTSAAPRRGAERVKVRMKSAGMDSSLPPFPPDRPKIDVLIDLVSNFAAFYRFLAAPNLDLISGMSFLVFFLIFGPRGAPFWDLFPVFWHHFCEYEICIDFISLLGRILTSFSMVF